MDLYSHRLRGMASNAKLYTILIHDQCQYWPHYVNPSTNLSHASDGLRESMYQNLGPCTARTWTTSCLTYLHNPFKYVIQQYKQSLKEITVLDIYIFVFPYTYKKVHIAIYYIISNKHTLKHRCTKGMDQMQALCLAVKTALPTTFILQPRHILLWLWLKTLSKKILMLKPHRDTYYSWYTHTNFLVPTFS